MTIEKISVRGYILYKLDRTLAILGVIGLGAWALYVGTTESIQIAMAAIGGLVGYIGGRTGGSSGK
jgi:hypothetical protein